MRTLFPSREEISGQFRASFSAWDLLVVPLILTAPGYALKDGELRDLMPSALALLGFTKPVQMTGSALW